MILNLRWKGEGSCLQVDGRPLVLPAAVRIFEGDKQISYQTLALSCASTASKISRSSLSLEGQLNSEEVELIIKYGPEEVESRHRHL